MKIDIVTENSLIIPEYIVDIKNKSSKTIKLIEYFEKLKNLDHQIKEEQTKIPKIKKRMFKKRKFYKKSK